LKQQIYILTAKRLTELIFMLKHLDLSAVIEAFLLQFSMGKIEDVRKIIISKEIMELAGSLPVDQVTDDWKTEKEAYLTEKYCK